MDFHPSQIPIVETFIVVDEKAASDSAQKMVDLGFENLFVQFPEAGPAMSHNHPRFLPDFLREKPFRGNG